jgi:excinuclease ABC subunit B
VPTSIKREIMDVMESARLDVSAEKALQESGAALSMLSAVQLARRLNELESRMFKHAQNLEFEQAAQCRDEMTKLKEQALLR